MRRGSSKRSGQLCATSGERDAGCGSHGGKLILWHGFADPVVPTLNTIAYYERSIASQTSDNENGKGARKEGLRRTQEFAQLFLASGVEHCNGGADPILQSSGPDNALGRSGHRPR